MEQKTKRMALANQRAKLRKLAAAKKKQQTKQRKVMAERKKKEKLAEAEAKKKTEQQNKQGESASQKKKEEQKEVDLATTMEEVEDTDLMEQEKMASEIQANMEKRPWQTQS